MAIIALVTPADQNSPSVSAFTDECARLELPPPTLYLPANAQGAHDNVKANGGVLVAGGEKTAYALQAITPPADNIPIIVEYAGKVPDNAASNMTGFIGDGEKVAKNQLHALKLAGYSGNAVTVLLDSDNTNTVTQYILGKLLQTDNQLTQKAIALANTPNLTAADFPTLGFMMIPNAVFFENATAITGAVDASIVQMAYYPEFQYWLKHPHKGKAHVLGYNVPLTYRLAARWACDFLKGYWTSIPGFSQPILDPY